MWTVIWVAAGAAASVEVALCVSDGVSNAPHLPAVGLAVLAVSFAVLAPIGIAVSSASAAPSRVARLVATATALLVGFSAFALFDRVTNTDSTRLLAFAAGCAGIGGLLASAVVEYLRTRPALQSWTLAVGFSLPWLGVFLVGAAWLRAEPLYAGIGFALAIVLHRWLVSSGVRVASALAAAGFLIGLGVPGFATDVVRESETPAPSAASTRGGAAQHVILISVDTLRFDATLGSSGPPVPHLRAFASDSVEFTQARAPSPWTLPSVASIMTGLPPLAHGATELRKPLADSFTTLAEVFRDAGFATAALGTNPVLHPESGIAQGFDRYDFFPRLKQWESLGARLIRLISPDRFRKNASTGVLTDRAIQWIDENRDRRAFLWLHYYDPHLPYSPPEPYLAGAESPDGIGARWNKPFQVRAGMERFTGPQRAWLRALYDAELRYVDEEIGRFVRALRDREIYEASIILLTSDHGEEFWEHGSFEHGHTLYDELLRVPLLIKLPGSSVRSSVDVPVGVDSVYPTLLEVAGVESPPVSGAPSLVGAWSPAGQFPETPTVSTGLLYFEDRVSVVLDGFKYIRRLVSGTELLFDLQADPGELRSVADQHPDRVEAARRAIEAHREHARSLRAELGVEGEAIAPIDKQVLEQLRAVGYVE